ncbi:MAG: hypothetical protein ACK5ZJ_14715, partial [Acidobacteriota bacterium]
PFCLASAIENDQEPASAPSWLLASQFISITELRANGEHFGAQEAFPAALARISYKKPAKGLQPWHN